jgi:hypothetical protein
MLPIKELHFSNYKIKKDSCKINKGNIQNLTISIGDLFLSIYTVKKVSPLKFHKTKWVPEIPK